MSSILTHGIGARNLTYGGLKNTHVLRKSWNIPSKRDPVPVSIERFTVSCGALQLVVEHLSVIKFNHYIFKFG
jgi:hypothetical protein